MMIRLLTFAIIELGALAIMPAHAFCQDDAVGEWLSKLRSKDAAVRDKAAYDFHAPKQPTPKDFSRLLQALKEDPTSFVRGHVAAALGELSPADQIVTQALVFACSDSDVAVRAQAAVALSKIGDSAIPLLVKRLAALGSDKLADTDKDARALAFPLESYSDSSVVDSFLTEVKERSEKHSGSKRSDILKGSLKEFKDFADDFEAYAACFCQEAGIPIIPRLISLLGNAKTHSFALKTLCLISGVESLSQDWDSDDTNKRAFAREVMTGSGGDESKLIAMLIEGLRNPTTTVRLLALQGLGDVKSTVDLEGAKPSLIELLENPDSVLRNAVTDLLKKIETKSPLPADVLNKINQIRPQSTASGPDELLLHELEAENRQEAIPALVRRLQNPLPWSREIVSAALDVAPKYPNVLQALYDLLVDPTVAPNDASHLASRISGEIKVLNPSLIVCEALMHYEESCQATVEFVASLGKHGVEILLTAAQDKRISLEIRAAACLAVANVAGSDPSIISPLTALSNEGNVQLRNAAAEGLAVVGKPEKALAILQKKIAQNTFKIETDAGLLSAVVPRCPKATLGWLRSKLPADTMYSVLTYIDGSRMASEEFVDPLLFLVKHKDLDVRKQALTALEGFRPFGAKICASLIQILRSADCPSGETLQRLLDSFAEVSGNPDELDPSFYRALIDYRVRWMLEAPRESIIYGIYEEGLGDGQGVGATATSPAFPWPPPRFSSIAVSGKDFDRELLGNDTTTLGEVYKRLHQALIKCDKNFETALFRLPEGTKGFVVLSKRECVTQDGMPLQGDDRFCEGDRVPISLGGIASSFFFASPGYFRTVAFVVTDEAKFGVDDNVSLTALETHERILPSEVEQLPFKGMNCYALVYEFRKQPGESKGEKLIHGAQSAKVHLDRLGLITALSNFK